MMLLIQKDAIDGRQAEPFPAHPLSIGPVAVMSLQTGRIIDDVMRSHPGVWAAETIATQLAFIWCVYHLPES